VLALLPDPLPEIEPFWAEFVVPGVAVPWARAGRVIGKFQRSYTPKPQQDFMSAVRTLGSRAMADHPPLEGPVELSVLALYPWPKSMSIRAREKPGAEWKATRPDEDNLKKLVADALQGIAYRDDGQVASGHCWKKFGDRALLKVKVRALV